MHLHSRSTPYTGTRAHGTRHAKLHWQWCRLLRENSGTGGGVGGVGYAKRRATSATGSKQGSSAVLATHCTVPSRSTLGAAACGRSLEACPGLRCPTTPAPRTQPGRQHVLHRVCTGKDYTLSYNHHVCTGKDYTLFNNHHTLARAQMFRVFCLLLSRHVPQKESSTECREKKKSKKWVQQKSRARCTNKRAHAEE